jgi:hypothetical protein
MFKPLIYANRPLRVLIVLTIIGFLTAGFIPSEITADAGDDPPHPPPTLPDSTEGGAAPLSEPPTESELDLLTQLLLLLI